MMTLRSATIAEFSEVIDEIVDKLNINMYNKNIDNVDITEDFLIKKFTDDFTDFELELMILVIQIYSKQNKLIDDLVMANHLKQKENQVLSKMFFDEIIIPY